MNPPNTSPVWGFRRRFLITVLLVVSLAAGAAAVWLICKHDDRYPPLVSHALKVLPNIRSGTLLEGVLCRLGLAEDAMSEEQEYSPISRKSWYRFRVVPSFVLECNCKDGEGEFGFANKTVTGLLFRQEVRGANGRIYFSNLQPSWGEPGNADNNRDEKRP